MKEGRQRGIIFCIVAACVFLAPVRRAFSFGGKTGPSCNPCSNRKYLPALKKMLEDAKESIYISHLYFHVDEVTSPLLYLLNEAVDRGVDVKCIFEDSVQYNKESVGKLRRIGAEAKLDSSEIFSHSKFVVTDAEKVLVGSTNLSFMSISRNNETNVLIKDRAVAEWFENYFLAVWNETPLPEPVTSDGITTIETGFFGEELCALFDNARERICLIIYGIKLYPDDPDNIVTKVFDSLIRAKKRGVQIQVVFETSDYNEFLNKLTDTAKEYFEENLIDVSYETPGIITHAKLTVVDDSVVVGSSNWGYGGFKLYREANVLIRDKKIADSFIKYFYMVKGQGRGG
ncbi:MAG: phospholipase D-like domain-containing protein [bacterium]